MKIKIVSILVVLSLLFVLFIPLTGSAKVQSSRWADDWEEIKRLYYDEVQPAFAIQTLERRLISNKAPITDDVILNGILSMLKLYFGMVDNQFKFRDIVTQLMRSGKYETIVAYFSGSGELQVMAENAKERWLRPEIAIITVASPRLVVETTTEYDFEVYNEFEALIESEGVEIGASPLDAVELDATARKITGKVVGDAFIHAKSKSGKHLGRVKISVLPLPSEVTSAQVVLESDELEIGESTKYEVEVFDQNREPMAVDYSKMIFEISPTNLAELDVENRTITAKKAGESLALKVLSLEGKQLAEVNLSILGKVEITIEPLSAKVELGATETFLIKSSRPFKTEGLNWTLEPGGIAKGKEITAIEKQIQVEVEGAQVGETYLRVWDRKSEKLSEAYIEVIEKPVPSHKASMPAIPKEGPSKVPVLVGAGATTGLAIAGFTTEDKNNILKISAAGCAVVTGVLAYLYFNGDGEEVQSHNMDYQDDIRIQGYGPYLCLSYRF